MMMRKCLVLIVSILFYSFSFSQKNKTNTCSINPFEVYLDDKDNFSNVRDSPKGEIILKINNTYDYYILNITGFKDGWLKINKITGVDGYDISEFEGWIHSSIVSAEVTHSTNLLDKPNGKKVVGKLIGEDGAFKIKDLYCEWIKVEYKGIIGWVKSEKTCGNPVTTCP